MYPGKESTCSLFYQEGCYSVTLPVHRKAEPLGDTPRAQRQVHCLYIEGSALGKSLLLLVELEGTWGSLLVTRRGLGE